MQQNGVAQPFVVVTRHRYAGFWLRVKFLNFLRRDRWWHFGISGYSCQDFEDAG
jgi:hypothetical protein